MPKFTVIVKEVWEVPYEVEASDPTEAIEIVAREEVKPAGETEYSYTRESDEWDVFDENGELKET